MVNLTPKETTLLNEMKEQEKLCIEKYNQYAQRACDNRLKTLFQDLSKHESHHLQMLEDMSKGQVPQVNMQTGNQNTQDSACCAHDNTCSQQDWQSDKFLCADALSMEKHVSSVYDTGIFEFTKPEMRSALNWIQKQEQEHGEQIYRYMAQNNMYN